MKTGQPISAADGLHSVEVPVITRQSSLTGVFLTTTRSILHVMHLKREKKARRPSGGSMRRMHDLKEEIDQGPAHDRDSDDLDSEAFMTGCYLP